MFRNFNFWYLFAPLGAFVAAYVGYKRSHRNGKHIERLDARSAWLDIVVATLAASILCALFYIESHRGLYDFFVVDANDGLAELVGLMCMVIAPPIVSAIYGWGLWKLGHRCARIGVCSFHCRATQYRNRKGEIRYIIDSDDLAIAIAAATAKEQRTRLLLRVIFWKRHMMAQQNRTQAKTQAQPTKRAKAQTQQTREQRKVAETSATPQNAETAQLKNQTASFAPVSTDIRETTLPTAERPAPSEKLVMTTLYGPDGKTWEIEVPENRVADLQLAMLRYCNTMAATQKLIQTSMQEAEELRHQRIRKENWKSFRRELKKLDKRDRRLIEAALRQYPLLKQVIESENLHIRLRLVGKGANRQVRFYSMRFSAAS